MKIQRKKTKARWMPVCLSLALLLMPLSIMAEGQGWYVRRNSEHKQPVLDPAQQFVERCGGYYVDRAHGDDCAEKVIYVTFDAGYENGHVAAILDVLKKEQVPAAFFVLQHLLTTHPDLVCRMEKEGHLVCNHTMRHKDMTSVGQDVFRAELTGLADHYRSLTGKDMPKYYRPPRGQYDEKSLQWAQELGYKTILWSFAYADWDNGHQPEVERAKKKITDNMHNGAVILLHPTSKTNLLLLPDLIKMWKAEGYRFGTLDELTQK